MFGLVCFLLVTSVLSSHFRGGIISWRAVDPDNFDGRVSRHFTAAVIFNNKTASPVVHLLCCPSCMLMMLYLAEEFV